MKIYCIGGLGVDYRVFDSYTFNQEKIILKWINPLKQESLTSYSLRLIQEFRITSDDFIIGVSFGGLIAQVIQKHLGCQLILISSLVDIQQIPYIYRASGQLKLHRLIPIFILKKANLFTYWIFGVKQKEHKRILNSILQETDSNVLKWSLDQIFKWKKLNTKHVSIHGQKDRLIHAKANAIRIKDAGHFMIITHKTELQKLIHKLILENQV